jgi:hypothetical protein
MSTRLIINTKDLGYPLPAGEIKQEAVQELFARGALP